MYKVVGEKVKGIFRSQFAELYTVDERTHELVTDLGVSLAFWWRKRAFEGGHGKRGERVPNQPQPSISPENNVC